MTAELPTLSIPPEKLSEYLLNVYHVEGGSKAKWFVSRGDQVGALELLALNLAQHAFANWPGEQVDAPLHGVKHKILAPMDCPDGTSSYVLAIWMVEPDEPGARFITARPHRVKSSPQGA